MKWSIGALLLLAAVLNNALLFFFAAAVLALYVGADVWMQRLGAGLRMQRQVESRVFYGEEIAVTLSVTNGGGLPAPWVRLSDQQPFELAGPSAYREVFALAPGQTHEVAYTLTGRRRGVHTIGPLTLTVGDVFGQAQRIVRYADAQSLIVYPRVVPLERLGLPTLALLGDARSRRKILGDPARVSGVRDYAPGDPLHHVNWRATASTGRLQVKQFEPTTTLRTTVFLDMERIGYTQRDPLSATELAITVAASLISHLIGRRQEVGLVTNGQVALSPQLDGGPVETIVPVGVSAAALQGLRGPESTSTPMLGAGNQEPRTDAVPIRAGNGYGHLTGMLELLARLKMREDGVKRAGSAGFAALLERESLHLPWGSTVVAIGGALPPEVFGALHRLHEAGLSVVMLDIERRPDAPEMRARARALGVHLHVVPPGEMLTTLAQLDEEG